MTENKEMVKVEEQNSWEETFENEKWMCPAVNVHETEDDYVLVANMPGVSKENVKIKVADDRLILMGKSERSEFDGRYILRESGEANYYRTFRLLEGIDQEKINAEFANGQLTVKLAKHERVKPREIKIV